jgi:hypothetical protein
VSRSFVSSSTVGGFGGIVTYQVEYSIDGSAWTTARTDLIAGGNQDFTPVSASWWRIVGLTKGYYEWAMNEVALYAPCSAVSQVVLTTAPASGSTIHASYRVYQGN